MMPARYRDRDCLTFRLAWTAMGQGPVLPGNAYS